MHTKRERVVSCILYRDNAVLDSPDVAQVFY